MFKNLKWKKLLIFGFLGMAAGFAYYYFIGCVGNSCPITSNPYLMTGYGLGAGLVLGWDTKKPKAKNETENNKIEGK
ncbi:MAG TPA: hypothetical protein ENL21_01140 [Caldithrix abyssi]|uniref:YtxH domain-containing protein n=1 Tax=Caldithrix abyssi TaxID=187145 RepID=A0A7V5LIF6_CALAY|nr:hypothetical protein [Caldisericaceae bacterium]HHE54356.1 hypothetical protein [Caldithrix abyssi]